MKKLISIVIVFVITLSLTLSINAETVQNEIKYIDLGGLKNASNIQGTPSGVGIILKAYVSVAYTNKFNGSVDGNLQAVSITNVRYLQVSVPSGTLTRLRIYETTTNNVLFDSDINSYLSNDPLSGTPLPTYTPLPTSTPTPTLTPTPIGPTNTPTPTPTPGPTSTPTPSPTPKPFSVDYVFPENGDGLKENGTVDVKMNRNVQSVEIVTSDHYVSNTISGTYVHFLTDGLNGDTVNLNVNITSYLGEVKNVTLSYPVDKDAVNQNYNVVTDWFMQMLEKLMQFGVVILVSVLVLIALAVGAFWLINISKKTIKKGGK